jgi:hypothetical protein
MTEKIVGKILKKFQKIVEKFEEKVDCISDTKPLIVNEGDGLTITYDVYSKSLGIMNMDKDGEWMKAEDFDYIIDRIDTIYTDWCNYSDGVVEKELKEKDRKIKFYEKVITLFIVQVVIMSLSIIYITY